MDIREHNTIEMYHEQGVMNEDLFQNEEFRSFLKAYSYTLHKLGNYDHALEIAKEAEKKITIH